MCNSWQFSLLLIQTGYLQLVFPPKTHKEIINVRSNTCFKKICFDMWLYFLRQLLFRKLLVNLSKTNVPFSVFVADDNFTTPDFEMYNAVSH